MSEVPEDALLEAFDRVLPPEEERQEMSDGEFAQVVMDNLESAKSILRNRGYDVRKSGESTPRDMLKSLYGSDTGTTTHIDAETARAVESSFRKPDVEADESSPPLSVHYGKSVDTAASSNKGDSFHESG
jgi:hypothetical protein